MAEYLLKVSFVISIALLFYKLVLQQESFFSTNRLYFICSILIAFLLPLIQLPQLINQQGFITSLFESEQSGTLMPEAMVQYKPAHIQETEVVDGTSLTKTREMTGQSEDATIEGSSFSGKFSGAFWLLALYLFGVAVFILNLFIQLGSIYCLLKKSTDKIVDADFVIVNTESKQAPCSFYKYIFIYPADYDFEAYEQIIAHEKIHVQQGHTWDLLLAELAVIVLWFNPFIWLYKKEVEKNIEFQTDALLLEQESIEKSSYQFNLLQIAIPHKPLTITTNYNQSLLKQRIMMMNARKSNMNSYWKYAFTAPLFLGVILMLNEPVQSQNTKHAVSGPAPLPSPHAIATPQPVNPVPSKPDNRLMTEGFFYSYQKEGQYCIDFKAKDKEGQWSLNECFNKALFEKQSDGVYTMTRETGTLTLTGTLEGDTGQGKYEFTKDGSFQQYLSDNNIEIAGEDYIFHLHLHLVDRKYIDFVKEKFANISGDQLLAMAIHGINQQYIDALAQAGFKDFEPDQLLAAKIHDLDPAAIQELEALGFGNLGLDQLTALKIHKVDGQFIEDLRQAGFADFTIDGALAAKIHDLDPAAIKDIRSLGFDDLSLNKMIELKIHDIDKTFIQQLKAAGFTGLSIDEVMQAKIIGLDPSTVAELNALGFGDISFEKMIQAKIHHVDAAYLNDLKSVGFSEITIDKAIEAKIHGIDSDFIKEAKAKGYNLKTLDEYIGVKIHGIARNGNND